MATLPPPPPPPPPPSFFGLSEPSMVNFGSDARDGFENHRTTSYDINNNIMLTAIISLSFVVALVTGLHIYARCALRRHQARRRVLFNISGLAVANANSGEQPKTGLDPGVIASLPTFLHKQIDGETSTECAVCLSMLEDQEMARLLPNCKHTFHAECIDKWLSSHSTCPICRTEAEPKTLQPEPREGPASGAAPVLVGVDSVSRESASSDAETNPSSKVTGSTSRLSSFRRILSRERSSRRLHPEVQQEGFEDLERQ